MANSTKDALKIYIPIRLIEENPVKLLNLAKSEEYAVTQPYKALPIN